MKRPPVRHAIALAIAASHDPALVLAVRRPEDDPDVPGVWGLPATTIAQGESVGAAARRVGAQKLGAPVRLGKLIASGQAQRQGYRLHLTVYAAELIQAEPVLPPTPDQGGVTYYKEWRWASPALLEDGVRKGSICCKLFLEQVATAT